MSEDLVKLATHGAVNVVTMNVAAKRNALSPALRDSLLAAFEASTAAENCRAIVLAAEGQAFCAGGDLSSMRNGDAAYARNRMRIGHQLVRLIVAGPKPVVAAVNGAAFGAGMSLAAASDLVVAGTSASFGAVFGKVGLMADWGLIWSLPQRVGLSRARQILYGSEVLDAQQALADGLVDYVMPDDQVLARAIGLAQEFACSAPLAIALTKAAFARGPSSLDQSLQMEADAQVLLFSTEDFLEGRAAFSEKRAPLFKGK